MANNNITTILERLESIQPTITATINGVPSQVLAAYAYEPADPASAQTPFFVNEVRGGPTVFQATGGLQRVDTHIMMTLCVVRIEADSTLYQAQSDAHQWRDAVLISFASKLRLGNDLSFIMESHIVNWDIIRRGFGTTDFIALVFDLSVTELFPLTIAP